MRKKINHRRRHRRIGRGSRIVRWAKKGMNYVRNNPVKTAGIMYLTAIAPTAYRMALAGRRLYR